MARKTLVLAEAQDGELRNVSFEAIAAGKQIADGGEVIAVIFGNGIGRLGEKLIQFGASRVLIVEDEKLENYTPDAYKQALEQVFESENAEAIVFGHTAIGKDLAARFAGKLKSGLISDVTKIEVDGSEILFTRPVYSGKAFETKKFTDGIVFITIRPNNIPALVQDASLSGDIRSFNVEINDLRTIVKEILRKSTGGMVDLSEAKIVIAGGRGVKSEEGFKPLYELAEVLGAAIGASRGAADAGYCDYSLQIGQTGKVVTPDLYIACGISGAIQHLAGMSNSKVIVAINKDPEANIFKVADYGIVGDIFEVVPKLTEEFKSLLLTKLS